MKYTIEQKAQLMALQNPESTFVCEFEEYVLLTDGHVGYYIKKSNLMLNVNKLKKPISFSGDLAPEKLFEHTTQASRTRNIYLIPGGRMAIKLKAENGEKAWVNMNLLKPFGESVSYRITSRKDPVMISNYRGIPLGIVMPINVTDEGAEEGSEEGAVKHE